MASVVLRCSYLHVWISWRPRSYTASITDAVAISHVITTFQSFEHVIARATNPDSRCIVNPRELPFAQLRRWLMRFPAPANPTLQHACLHHRFCFHFSGRPSRCFWRNPRKKETDLNCSADSICQADIHLPRWGNVLPALTP